MQQTKAQKADLQITAQHVMRVLAVYADNYAAVYYSTDHRRSAAACIVLAEYAKNAAALLALYADAVLYDDIYRDYITD